MIKKSLFKLSVAAILVASVAACSSSSSTTPVTPGTDTGGDTGAGVETGVLPVILDRMGRPGVSTALIADNAVKDAYNLAGNPAEWASQFTDPIVSRLNIIDNLDGTMGNALLLDSQALATLLVDDRLRINTATPECDVYLALEIGLGGCGGRTLARDVIDDTLTHLVSFEAGFQPISDLANNDSTFQSDWPFLGTAN